MIVYFSLVLLLNSVASKNHEVHNEEEIQNLRVMTFNIWNSAQNVENGQQKVAKHILLVNPDIVALQEVYTNVSSNIAKMLGHGWKYLEHPHPSYPDTAIFTRHEIVPNTLIFTQFGLGCEILLSTGRIVHFWNAHLDYLNYGPSEAFKNVTNVSQIVGGEYIKRAPGMLEILNLPEVEKWLSKSSGIPIILCGDFNVPSHFDWIEETKNIHNNWIVEWPTTRYLESYGFIDSFREAHPNVLENPGLSWSTVSEYDENSKSGRSSEPPDRVDFIFYRVQMLVFCLILLLNSAISQSQYQEVKNEEDISSLRVMTFNIWNSGANVENGQQKIAKHILLVNPDIVALQEVYVNVSANITKMLGPGWKYLEHINSTYPDTAILTRHVIIPETMIMTEWGLGCKIMLRSGPLVNVWSSHLDYRSYGPYAAFNKLVTDINQIMAGELTGRTPQIIEILNLPQFQTWLSKSSEIPIIFCGDFNAPSHLDWTYETQKHHGDWSVEWPTTKHLESYGFIDSFREIYPNVLENPGLSWSTVNKYNPEWNYTIPEPQDRLDFIFYKGPLVAFQSALYSGYEKLDRIPYHFKNDYPSDHFAVFTDFTFIE